MTSYILPARAQADQFQELVGRLYRHVAEADRGFINQTPDGTTVPRVSNREAVALAVGFRNLAQKIDRPDLFRLWYQFAALAYGWDPQGTDKLKIGKTQADDLYPLEGARELWLALFGLAVAIERESKGAEATVEFDRDDFEDVLVQASVQDALRGDGAKADIEHPISCRQPDGKVRMKRPPCDKDGRGPVIGLNPATGKPVHAECDKPGDCEPIGIPTPDLLVLGLWIGIAYVVWQEIKPANAPVIRLEKRLARLERRRR